MELNAFISKDTILLALKDPRTGKDTDAALTLAGPAHAQRRSAERALLDAMLSAAQDGGDKLTDEQRAAANTAYLASCVLGWQGVTEDGAEVPYTQERMVALLGDPKYREIRDQLDRALGDKKRFFE